MSFLMNSKELSYQARQFYEIQETSGVPCVVKSLVQSEDSRDFYRDVVETVAYAGLAFNTFITYVEAPEVKTLKSLGWYVEDAEMQPILAYIPAIYKDQEGNLMAANPKVDDLIVMTSVNALIPDAAEQVREFTISKLKGQGFPNIVYYIANLVPYRKDATL